MIRAFSTWWAAQLRTAGERVVQFLRWWVLPIAAGAINTLGSWLWWRARLSFARRGLLGKGLYLTVALFLFGWVAASAGLSGFAFSLTHAAITVLSVVLAAGFIKLIWHTFTEEHSGLRR